MTQSPGSPGAPGSPGTPGSPGNPPPPGRDPSRPPVDASQVAAPPPYPGGPQGYMPMGFGPPPKQHGVLHRVAVSLIATVFIASVMMNIYFIIIFAGQMKRGVREQVYLPGDNAHKVTILDVNGAIDSGMAEYLREAFLFLEQNPPKALVLRVESGGGGVTASDQIWHYFSQFKAKNPDVKVVASFGSVAASGGYYIAAPADYIVCEQTGMTGSIGVMAPVLTFEGSLQKLGVMDQTQVADTSPDKETANTVFRTWGEQDVRVIKHVLNQMHERFVEVVAQGRAKHLSQDEVMQLATGKVYLAQEAVANKLVDEVGYLDRAIDKAAELAGVPAGTRPQVNIIRRPIPFSLLGLSGKFNGAGDASVSIEVSPEQARTWLMEVTQPRLEYRSAWP